MAIKGKKKSQSRGSQGQRRPAAAPRPTYSGRKHTPWYKTNEGRLVGGMLIAVIIGVTIWLVADAQNKSKEQTQTRESLEDYVKSVRSFTNALGPVAEEMGAVAPTEVDGEALKKDAGTWTTDLSTAQAQLASSPPPDEAEVAARLFEQSMSSFLSAARTFDSAAGAEGEFQTELVAQASEEVEQARGLFDLAVVALDEELSEVEGDPSNLILPQGNAPATTPPGTDLGSDTEEIDTEAGTDTETGEGGGQDDGGQDDGGNGGGQGGGGGGGQGDGN